MSSTHSLSDRIHGLAEEADRLEREVAVIREDCPKDANSARSGLLDAASALWTARTRLVDAADCCGDETADATALLRGIPLKCRRLLRGGALTGDDAAQVFGIAVDAQKAVNLLTTAEA